MITRYDAQGSPNERAPTGRQADKLTSGHFSLEWKNENFDSKTMKAKLRNLRKLMWV